MRKRNIKLSLRLTEQEHRHLKEQVALSGCSTEQYLRSLIAGENMKPRPPGEMAEIRRQLSAIGNNLNQLTKVANSRGYIGREDADRMDELRQEVWRVLEWL